MYVIVWFTSNFTPSGYLCTNREHNVQIGDILTSKDLITVIKGSSPQNNIPHKYVNMVAIGSLSDLPLKQ